ncbi:hypothetical protein NDU88_007453 [Pleurodeles waltl]|uniref:Uncharacterized protein n=1 Tax=Pleurodeles waltl TaxID=8319 RepID=A0AAV7TZT3_PLEWA|nr:hypothetical protein NDU88_007453 [Pleurodeles waltl]
MAHRDTLYLFLAQKKIAFPLPVRQTSLRHVWLLDLSAQSNCELSVTDARCTGATRGCGRLRYFLLNHHAAQEDRQSDPGAD